MRTVLTLAFLVTLSTPALADDSRPAVHVESDVRLDVAVADTHRSGTPVCHAPCDERLDPNTTYRLSGDGFRTSNRFRLLTGEGEDRVRVRLEPRTAGGLLAGVILLSISGALATGGAIVVGWAATDTYVNYVGVAAAISIPLFVASVATGIPGAILLSKNIESRAVVMGSDAVASSSHRPAMSGPAAFVVPIVSRSF